ncbi:MAG: PDZ domain-containing protein [Planctomycetes bacterium]|nr:PDZ domain-containing protein [Planctomycetota bacterium]
MRMACALSAVVALCGLPLPVGGDTVPFNADQLPRVRALLPDLNADDFAKREAASTALRDDVTLSLDSIGMAFAEPSLTAEQRQRLMTAFRARFSSSPRPAVGIGFGVPGDDNRGVLINSVNRGFPSVDAGIIKLGDIIVSLNGHALVSEDPNLTWEQRDALARATTIALIQSHDPGDMVPAVVLRLTEPGVKLQEPVDFRMRGVADKAWARERVEVKLPLGRYDTLPAARGYDPSVLLRLYGETAMDHRLRRLGVAWPGAQPIRALQHMDQALVNLPMAANAPLALALTGAGFQPGPMNTNWIAANLGRNLVVQDRLNQRAFMNVGQVVVQDRMNPGRLVVREQRAQVRFPENVNVRVLRGVAAQREAESALSGASAPAPADASDTLTSEVRGLVRDLKRLSELRAELTAAEARAANPALDQPSQREAENRARTLRESIDALETVIRVPGLRAEPTASTEGDPLPLER